MSFLDPSPNPSSSAQRSPNRQPQQTYERHEDIPLPSTFYTESYFTPEQASPAIPVVRDLTDSPAPFSQYYALQDSNASSPSSLAAPRNADPSRSSVASDEILSWLERTPKPTSQPSGRPFENVNPPVKHSQLPSITTSNLSSSSSQARVNPSQRKPPPPTRASKSYLDFSDPSHSPTSSIDFSNGNSRLKSKKKKTGFNSLFRRQVPSPTSPLHAKFMTTRREIISIVPVKIIQSPQRRTPSNTPISRYPSAHPSYSSTSSTSNGVPMPTSASSTPVFSLGRTHHLASPSSFSSDPQQYSRAAFQSHQTYSSHGSSISTPSQKLSSKACRILGLDAPPVSPQHSLFAPDPPKPRYISHTASSSAASSGRSVGSISSPLASASSRPSIDTPYGSPQVSFVTPQQHDGSYAGSGGVGTSAVAGPEGAGVTLKRAASIVPSKAKQVLGMLPPKAEKLLGIEEGDGSSDSGHHAIPLGMVWQLPAPTAGGGNTPEPSPIPLLPPRLPDLSRDSGLFSLYFKLDAFSLSTTSLPEGHVATIPRSPKTLPPSLHQHSQSVPWAPPNPLSHVRQRKKSALASSSIPSFSSIPLPNESSQVDLPPSVLRRRPTLPTANLPPSLRESCLLPDDDAMYNRSPPPAMPVVSVSKCRERNSRRLTLVSAHPPSAAQIRKEAGGKSGRSSSAKPLRSAQKSAKRSADLQQRERQHERQTRAGRQEEEVGKDVKTLEEWEEEGWWSDEHEGEEVDAEEGVGRLMFETTLTDSDGHGVALGAEGVQKGLEGRRGESLTPTDLVYKAQSSTTPTVSPPLAALSSSSKPRLRQNSTRTNASSLTHASSQSTVISSAPSHLSLSHPTITLRTSSSSPAQHILHRAPLPARISFSDSSPSLYIGSEGGWRVLRDFLSASSETLLDAQASGVPSSVYATALRSGHSLPLTRSASHLPRKIHVFLLEHHPSSISSPGFDPRTARTKSGSRADEITLGISLYPARGRDQGIIGGSTVASLEFCGPVALREVVAALSGRQVAGVGGDGL